MELYEEMFQFSVDDCKEGNVEMKKHPLYEPLRFITQGPGVEDEAITGIEFLETIGVKEKISEEKVNWARDIKGQGVKLYILSNSNKKEKVKKIAEILDIPYKYFGLKPFKKGFKKIAQELKEDSKKIGVVGDQIFTDIWGGNRCKMFTILVDPIKENDYWYTLWKRPIENKIKKKITKEKKDVF